MKIFFTIVVSALVAGAAAHRSLRRPFQLTLRRESNTSLCDIVSFSETQLHKGLLPATRGHVIRKQSTVPSTGPLGDDEIIHLLSYSTDELWMHAQLECSNDLAFVVQSVRNGFEAQVTFKDQEILLSTLEVSVPPLEVVSLLQSGPSDNRVDLAFFSDGCKFASILSVFVASLVFFIQTRCVKEISFSRMRCVWSPTCRQIRHLLPSGL